MKNETSQIVSFILDANIIIDFQNTKNLDITKKLSSISSVSIVEQTRRKIRGLTPTLCNKLGLKILIPEFEEVILASEIKNQTKQLAVDDSLTLAVGISRKQTIVSNDRRMIAAASNRGKEVSENFFFWSTCLKMENFQLKNALKLLKMSSGQIIGWILR